MAWNRPRGNSRHGRSKGSLSKQPSAQDLLDEPVSGEREGEGERGREGEREGGRGRGREEEGEREALFNVIFIYFLFP